MVARVIQQAVVPGGQHDWRLLFARLRGLLLMISAGGLLIAGGMKLNDPGLLPVQKVRVQGAFINLTEDMLLTSAGGITGGYFNIDVEAVKQNIESLAWVDKAYVRRMWPDTLMITVTEQQAVADWNGNGLVNVRGELFYPEKKTFPGGLPHFTGPQGTHQQLLEHYKNMGSILNGVPARIQGIEMDARRSLTIRFENGLTLLLGRKLYYQRLARFLRIYNKMLVTEIGNIDRIDMRYTNGFTVLRKE